MKKTMLLLAFCGIGAVLQAGEGIDTILYNGSVLTMKNKNDSVEAIAVNDGKIVSVGKSNDILKLADKNTKKIDLDGKTVMPGLTDTHLHFLRFGLTFLQIRGNGKTKDEILLDVKEKAKLAQKENWVRGRGWNETIWDDKKLPLASDLDTVSKNNPVVLFRSDNHAIWVNSETLKIAGINKETMDPDGGKIIRDSNGNPTGILVDSAMNLVTDKMPALSEEEMETAYLLADKEYSRLGLTTIFDAGDDISIPLVKRLISEGKIKTRINVVLDGKTAKTFLDNDIKAEHNTLNDHMSIRGYKIKYDGALGSRGALMDEEYSDSKGNFGNRLIAVDELNRLVEKSYELGYQPHVHAIGDKANEEVLDSFEKLFKEKEKTNKELRYGVVHSQILTKRDIGRYKDMDVIAIMQPIHATSDMNMAEDRIGADRIKGAYAWKTLNDSGVIITGGSDNPNDYIEPFYGIHAAVTRKDMKGNPKDGWYPEEAIDLYSALKIYTQNPAYLWFMEDKLGTIEDGKYADLVVLSDNIKEVNKDDLWKVKPTLTFIDGEVVYKVK